jgi:hypothetical protein
MSAEKDFRLNNSLFLSLMPEKRDLEFTRQNLRLKSKKD